MKQILLLSFITLFSFGVYSQTFNESQGSGSGASISTGDYNTLYGDSSGANLSTSHENVLMGFNSGFSINLTSTSQANYNVMIGNNAGYSNTTADENIFIGYQSGYSNKTGTDNVFIGFRSGYFNTATDGVFIGNGAGFNNTDGLDNTFIGEAAGLRVTSGDDNTFVGNHAGGNYTSVGLTTGATTNPLTGSDNTAVGSSAGVCLTTGFRNAFFGNEAGYDNTTGHHNTFLGDSAGIDGKTGIYNTFVGAGAGPTSEYPSYCTFVGGYAGWDNGRTNNDNNSDGMRNTYFGYKAGYTNREGKDNVVIGANADFSGSGYTTNNYNVIIGNYAETKSDNRSNNILLGYSSETNKNDAIAIGFESSVRGERSIGIGSMVDINNQRAIGMGYQTYINGDYSIAFGYQDSIMADSSITIGFNNTLSGSNTFALGNSITSSATNSILLGGNTQDMTVGVGTVNPNPNASLDLASTNKGLLMSRMTNAERTTFSNSLAVTEKGMMVFDTDESVLYTWNGTMWNASTNTDAQDLGLAGNILSLSNDASTVDLSAYLDNTDTQLTEAEVDAFADNNGYLTSFTELDGDATNEIQDIALAGTNLSITSGSTIDLSAIQDGFEANTDTQLSEAEVDAFTDNNGYLTSFTEVDGDATNEIQDIALAGTDLSITSGSTIDLSAIQDGFEANTDTQLSEAEVDAFTDNNGYLTSFTEVDGDATNEIQDIALTGTDLSITSGSTIDLTAIQDGFEANTDTQLSEAEVDAFTDNNGYLTSFTEVDGDATNEIQDITLVGTDLSISNGSTIDMSSFLDNTDTQLTEAEVDDYVNNNGYLTSFAEVDGDPTNEIQDISLSGSELSITNGSSIDLSSVVVNSDEQDLTSATLVGTTLEIEIENGSSVSVDLTPLIASLEAQISDHADRLVAIEECACDGTLDIPGVRGEATEKAILYQNIPNPFNNTSVIKYYIPSYASSSNLVVSNNRGQIISNLKLQEIGDYGSEHINAEGLAPGVYFYSLYINQTLVDTKKMVIE